MAVRFDPFRTITNVHWNASTEAPTEVLTEPPTDNTEVVWYEVHFQVITGNTNQNVMCSHALGSYAWGLLRYGLLPLGCTPNGFMTLNWFWEPDTLPEAYGFYTVRDTQPIVFPTGEPVAYDPAYSVLYPEDIGIRQILDGDVTYRYFEVTTDTPIWTGP